MMRNDLPEITISDDDIAAAAKATGVAEKHADYLRTCREIDRQESEIDEKLKDEIELLNKWKARKDSLEMFFRKKWHYGWEDKLADHARSMRRKSISIDYSALTDAVMTATTHAELASAIQEIKEADAKRKEVAAKQ